MKKMIVCLMALLLLFVFAGCGTVGRGVGKVNDMDGEYNAYLFEVSDDEIHDFSKWVEDSCWKRPGAVWKGKTDLSGLNGIKPDKTGAAEIWQKGPAIEIVVEVYDIDGNEEKITIKATIEKNCIQAPMVAGIFKGYRYDLFNLCIKGTIKINGRTVALLFYEEELYEH